MPMMKLDETEADPKLFYDNLVNEEETRASGSAVPLRKGLDDFSLDLEIFRCSGREGEGCRRD